MEANKKYILRPFISSPVSFFIVAQVMDFGLVKFKDRYHEKNFSAKCFKA